MSIYDDQDEYITVEEAARVLQLSPRMVNRYGNPPYSKLRTHRVSRRVLYNRSDVEALAEELGVARQARPATTKAELVPIGEVLGHIRQLEAQLAQAMHEAGRLQGQLEQQQKLIVDAEATQQRLADLEAERNELRDKLEGLTDVETERNKLREELEHLRNRPWWKRVFRRSKS